MWHHKSTNQRLDELEEKLERLLNARHEPSAILHQLKHLEHRIMSALDDLKANMSELTTEVNRIGGEIDQLLVVISTPGASEADIADAAAQIKALTGQLKTASDKSDAQVP